QDKVSDASLKAAMEVVKTVPTAVWLDRIEAIHGGVNNANRKSLEDHFELALAQKRPGVPMTVKIVVYNLPNRDCSALASNGTLQGDAGLETYKTDYIDVIGDIAKQERFQSLRIVAVIEPDSLPNLVTNKDLQACGLVAQKGYYVKGIQHALKVFSQIDNVYTYLDIGHGGWLGWDSNMGPAVTLYSDMVAGVADGDMTVVDGVISNVSGYTPVAEPHIPGSKFDPAKSHVGMRGTKFYDWNDHVDETSFLEALHAEFVSAGFPSDFAMLIDTSRNGWGGEDSPHFMDTPTTVADNDEFVEEFRIDRRSHRGNWC
ncbi:MAG: glycoside hydrolase family 6 protein, partial [Deltaproteobacteria bacterium]|nr:glycoside hydrolase family 6 protein [Deltaproteobacteria bacterium]